MEFSFLTTFESYEEIFSSVFIEKICYCSYFIATSFEKKIVSTSREHYTHMFYSDTKFTKYTEKGFIRMKIEHLKFNMSEEIL